MYFPSVLRKEGPIEHLTHVILATGLLLWGVVLVRAPRDARVLGFTFLQLFFLGEEVNWGQNFWPFETPQWAIAMNGGRDTGFNFHNNGVGEKAFILAVAWALIFSPIVAVFQRRASFTPVEIAIATVNVAVLTTVTTRVGALMIGYDNAEPRIQELMDCLVAVLMTEVARWRFAEQSRGLRRSE